MKEALVIHIASQAMVVTAKIAAPILLASLGIGLFVSIIQSVTQIQEFTLTFVPKVAGIALVFIVAGHWMMSTFLNYTTSLYNELPRLLTG